MILGQSATIAVVYAIEDNVSVQKGEYKKLHSIYCDILNI